MLCSYYIVEYYSYREVETTSKNILEVQHTHKKVIVQYDLHILMLSTDQNHDSRDLLLLSTITVDYTF